MSNRPQHKTLAQATLYHLGEKRLGASSANVLSDVEVRRAGARRVMATVGKLAAVTALSIGAVKLGINANEQRVSQDQTHADKISAELTERNRQEIIANNIGQEETVINDALENQEHPHP